MAKELKINVVKEIVEAVQAADYKVQAMTGVLTSLLEQHSTDPAFLDAPVVVKYTQMLADARKDFEDAKRGMLQESVSGDVLQKAGDWNLDYASCVLTVQIPA